MHVEYNTVAATYLSEFVSRLEPIIRTTTHPETFVLYLSISIALLTA